MKGPRRSGMCWCYGEEPTGFPGQGGPSRPGPRSSGVLGLGCPDKATPSPGGGRTGTSPGGSRPPGAGGRVLGRPSGSGGDGRWTAAPATGQRRGGGRRAWPWRSTGTGLRSSGTGRGRAPRARVSGWAAPCDGGGGPPLFSGTYQITTVRHLFDGGPALRRSSRSRRTRIGRSVSHAEEQLDAMPVEIPEHHRPAGTPTPPPHPPAPVGSRQRNAEPRGAPGPGITCVPFGSGGTAYVTPAVGDGQSRGDPDSGAGEGGPSLGAGRRGDLEGVQEGGHYEAWARAGHPFCGLAGEAGFSRRC